MATTSDRRGPGEAGVEPRAVRVAAVADVHSTEAGPSPSIAALGELDSAADLLLLAGDLTTHGRAEQVAPLAEVCAELELPVIAVLGNHDHHSDRPGEVAATLGDAGVRVLDGASTVVTVDGVDVGVVGTKGFVGGFAGSHLTDFGEPSLRALYRETGAEVEALDRGLRDVAVCPLRIVVLHYAPIADTLVGEREGIWAFLGTDRLAAPLIEHGPDLVVHGHAHAGTFAGKAGEVDVFNVSVPVIGRDYWLFELAPAIAGDSAIP